MAGEATRRGLLAGAGAAAVTIGLERRLPEARATTAAPSARPDVVYRGRSLAVSADGRRLLAIYVGRRDVLLVDRPGRGKRRLTLGGQPLEAAFAPNGRYIAIATAFWDEPALELIDATTGARRARLKAGPAPFAPAFTADGRHLLVTGGEQDGTLRIYDAPHLHNVRSVQLGRVPRGIAVHGKHAWVALNGEDAVVKVDIGRGRVTKRFATPAHPDRIALSPDGSALLVTHPSRTLTELDTRHGHVKPHIAGAHPAAVAWTPAGVRIVAIERDVLALDPRRRHISTVTGPRGLAVAGRNVFVISALDGEIAKVRA